MTFVQVRAQVRAGALGYTYLIRWVLRGTSIQNKLHDSTHFFYRMLLM